MSTSFFKSTHSGTNGTCVEVAFRSTGVLIRDSKYTGNPAAQPVITVASARWRAFLDLALSGESRTLDDLSLTVHSDGSAVLNSGNITLTYTPAEWNAFIKGIADGQFDRPV